MANRLNRQRPFARPKTRTKMWIGGGFGETNVGVGSTATLLASLNAAALLLRPFTILRTRVTLFLGSDQFGATESNQGVLAAQVVTDSAAAAGIASVPTPLDEFTADFYVYQPWDFGIIFATAVGVSDVTGQRTIVIDSKAMRKVGHDDNIVYTCAGRGAAGYNVALEGRLLIQLH